MKAIPRILVRIDRGEDFVEICADWQELPVMCGQGDLKEWLVADAMYHAWHTLNEAVME